MKRKYIIWLIIIIAIIAGGYFYFSSRKPKTEYTTADAAKGNVVQTVSVTGELVSENQADLSFKSSGEVKKIYVKIGDEIKKGQRIADLDISGLLIDLGEAEKDIDYQKKTLANMKRRDDTYNREQEDAQRALVKKAELSLEDIKRQIREKSIYSPIDGMLIKKGIEEGEMATANVSVFTVAQGDLILESNIPESDIVKIIVGQKADIVFDALDQDEKFEAEVIEVEPAATIIQDVVYYKTKLKLSSQDDRWKNGMSADIDIKTAEKQNVLAVPARAIKTEGGRKYVEILIDAEKNITEKKFVQTGLEGDEGMVEIVSGLNGGERVVTLTKTQ